MHGLLFSSDFLREGIRQTPGWMQSESAFVRFREAIAGIFRGIDAGTTFNEPQTEDDIILRVMAALGWTDFMRQASASAAGRSDVPDFLFFADADAKRAARAESRADRRYRHGLLLIEAKRWQRALDRGDGGNPLDPGTPSSQMLRYLSRAEVASDGAVRWGILTNGAVWRLYWQGARSRSEEFLQFDLAALAAVAGVNAELFAADSRADDVHYLRAFFLLFRREAFLPQPGDAEGRSFHALALDEGRRWESKVSQDLGDRVFGELFPQLAAAIVRNDRAAARPLSRAYLDDVHRAALVLLYRLLFVLYAEDRGLLPVSDRRYDDYSLRWQRDDIATRRDRGDTFSATATRIWQHLRSLFHAVDRGDDSIGLPPYNGGLFHEEADEPGSGPGQALLARIELRDAELAPLIDGLSRRPDTSGGGFINYRDLAVQHLGSIYERLLEQRLVETAGGGIAVQPSAFARKNTGSYYTHDDLVKLILQETIKPLADERIAAFDARVAELKRQRDRIPAEQMHPRLAETDPAEALLSLKVCDPAMGSGHFLVSLVDDLADRVLEQLADASAKAAEAGIAHYRSPIARDIESLRERIESRANASGWHIDHALLDDRHLVRRMILKRVVHGVDKNPMAVELAKLTLWLHTFTVGAPLSFLDHHLRCGDSLYGERLATVRADLARLGELFSDSHTAGLMLAAQTMQEVSALNDVDLAEVERSRELAAHAFDSLDGLRRVFDLWQALRWIAPLDAPRSRRTEKHETASELLSGRYRMTLLELLRGDGRVHGSDASVDARVNALLDECRALAARERFLHWELAFPGVWRSAGAQGGFDAVIGNPPWDRMKLQEVEWFAERRPEIARQARAADRKRMIDRLKRDGDPLAGDYDLAAQRADDAARVARGCGEYPLLSSGDINLYSLFVERAATLAKPTGMVGLLTPSGIAADKGAARFFRGIATTGRLAALVDFENRKKLFPDVDSRFKFCALAFGGQARRFDAARCAFFLHATDALLPPQLADDADERTRKLATRVIPLSAADFRAVNPNTGTAPIFRNALDAELTTRLYRTHPVLVRHAFATTTDPATGAQVEDIGRIIGEERLYPVRYCTMFHMTNDSHLFKRRDELEADGWYPVAGGRWRKGEAEMLPLYVGRMIQHYDHRAANVTVNEENLHNAALSGGVNAAQKRDPDFSPTPQYWVSADAEQLAEYSGWAIGFRDIARSTDVRTFIAAIVPTTAAGNKLPFLFPNSTSGEYAAIAPLLLANVNALSFDFVARQKVQSTSMNWFIVEQLPLIAPSRYAEPLGRSTIGDFVREQVLRLSYTAHDLAAFARDLGHDGPPFAWDPEDRRHRIARLDALYFRLYGLDRDEAAYVLDTFPIVREQDERAYGRYRTRALVLGYMAALDAGDTDSVIAH
jgi:hypothetical protein